MQKKAIATESDVRGLLRSFGLRGSVVGTIGFDAGIRELVDDMPEISEIMRPLLAARQKLRETFMELHRKLLAIVRVDEVCCRLMTIPGVGPVTSLAFTSTIDVPARFANSRSVGPALGLTPTLHQPSESHRVGRIFTLWRRHDARPALRGGSGHAEPGEEMVLA